jgi:tyrosine-protein kinase Etk/Wzc
MSQLQIRLTDAPLSRGRQLDLFDVLLIFARQKWLLIIWTVGGALVGLIFLLQQTKLFRATAVIMPPQQEQASSALLGQLGALAGLAGGGGGGLGLGLKNPADLYIGLLKSRSVADDLVNRFHLMDVYGIPNKNAAAGKLAKRSKFVAEKDGLISVEIEDKSPERSAALANGYIDELYRLNNRLAIGSASQRRLFFEQQLLAEKDKLADAEVALRETQEKTGVLTLTGQMQTVINAEAVMEANISNHEVQLASARAGSTEQNPEVVRLSRELEGLQAQLLAMQKSHNGASGGMSQAQLPAAGLAYIRKQRDVQYHQTLFELLARQLEAARIDEAKASPTIQVIDPPQVPDAKSWPSTPLFLVVGAFLGFVCGCIRCTMVFLYSYADADPRLHGKFRAVKQALRLRA